MIDQLTIIKSKGLNWSGKEFSELPAKIYCCFEDAAEAIKNYHFFEWNYKTHGFEPVAKQQKIEFIFLSENRKDKLLKENKVRF